VLKPAGADWAYRCNPAGADLERTKALLTGGFCWRTVYNVNCAFIANVKAVRVYDTIAVFYVVDKTSSYLGTFEVLAPILVATAETPALHKVTGGTLEDELFSAHYEPDPCLRAYTGFCVKPFLFAGQPVPPNWPNPNALVRMRTR
jgi:hypothetical protein